MREGNVFIPVCPFTDGREGVPLSLSWNKGGGRGGAGNDVLGGGVGYPCPFPAQGVGGTPVLVLEQGWGQGRGGE